LICAGIDAGSRTVKVALIDAATGRVLASGIADQAADQAASSSLLFDAVLRKAALRRSDVSRVVATGYGRQIVPFAGSTVTEITCQAKGVRRLVPGAMTVIDVGGQDTKLIRLDPDGIVRDFAMNDRCAAGTGRFLEVVAEKLAVPLDELAAMAARSRMPSAINSTCVVFAESEIIGLLAAGASASDVAAGVQASLASRVAKMVGRGIDAPVVFTGGVALLPGMHLVLEAALGQAVTVAPDPQMTCALGAALLAAGL
jgi:predicted CoA-substrate-specific enzyme activase